MRKWFACLGVLGLAATAATAQTIPSSIGDFLVQTSEDDGFAETSWKIFYPSAAGEGFDVDFNTDAGSGANVFGVAVQTYISQGSTINFSYVAICGDNLALDASGRTPDLGSPLSIVNNPTGGVPGPYCSGFTTYDLPDVNTGTGGIHASCAFPTGDTTTWLCADMFDSSSLAHTGPRHSFFTTDNYATPASYPFTNFNWMIRLAGAPPTPNGGSFLINGSLAATVGGGNTMALQFWSADNSAPTKYLEVLDVGPLIPLPGIILSTGFSNFSPIGIQALGQLSGAVPCSAIGGPPLNFRAFFADNLDLKPSGHKKIKLTAAASVTIVQSKTCNPNLCFGIRDDGVMDGTIFKVTSPAGSKDALTVDMGFVDSGTPTITNLTAVEQCTWDFCGGSCWQNVGIYPANTVVDPSGHSPDLSNPVSQLSGTSACYPGGSFTGTWGFPATVYDTPDVAANTTTHYHCTFEWANFDSCLWIGTDVNGTADDSGLNCGDNTSSFTYNYFTQNGFSTPGTNWLPYEGMQRIDWN